MPTIPTSDGALIVATVHGPADDPRPPILLIHGLSQQRHFWDPVAVHLAHRRVITVDLRGHGEADVPADADFAIDRCARDVIECLDALQVNSVALVGHSWGASVALHTAATHPSRVDHLTLIDGAIVVPSQLGDPVEVRRRLTPPRIQAPDLGDIMEAIQRGPLGDSWTPEVEAALRHTFRRSSDGTWTTAIGWDRHMRVLDDFLMYDPDPDWARLTTPTLLICCATDEPWAAVRDRNLAALPPNVRVEMWPDAIHDVPLQWPARVAASLDTV